MNKQDFIRACRQGGDAIEQALREIDRSYFRLLHRDCLRTIRDVDLARDVVQETFIKVWQRCATFQGDSELLPWIKTIMRHNALDRLRKPQLEVPMEHDGVTTAEADRRIAEFSLTSLARPEDEALRRQVDDCFARCWKRFEQAAPAHAAVMTWIVEDGLTNDQISELLGRSPGATREFISQCRKRARVHLAEWYELAFGVR